ncbi:protein dead ringer-like [Ctenocephalides felis]|uniref:protein dead ringer-like n=1 Tax=Ctenocephalides felis TaxID=7515 RepID=UPI000E6E1188|nr:protein dead ringer-like [Ctenocephalides felis]
MIISGSTKLLYEINDDPKRKEFLDDLFQFMQKRGTPINRLPIMAKSVLDLFELYNLVIARGGLVDVINKKLWQEIIKGLHLPSSITSAAFTLRTQYMKYLYPYECDKKNLSTPSELQAAIDGNRREGRRSSYGQYDAVQRSPVPSMHLSQQMSPLSLVTHHAHHVHQAHQAAQQAAAQQQRVAGFSLMGHGPVAGLAPHEIEQRMMEYMKLFQHKETRRLGSQSPPETVSPRDAALSALEMSRLTLWNLYNNNTSPPSSINNTSPPGTLGIEPQREALNLSESPPHTNQHNSSGLGNGVSVKRELTERDPPPPAKRVGGLASTDLADGVDSATIADEEEPEGLGQPAPVVLGTHFKITSRGDSSAGDQQLVVTIELNGVLYEGVLFANNSSAPHSPQAQRPRPMVT